MQPTNIMDSQAEMAYRASYLADQYHRPGARPRRDDTRSPRRRVHIRWRARTDSAD